MERTELKFLESLITLIDAKTVIEVGVQFGEMAVSLCGATIRNDGKYIGFDVWNEDPEFLRLYGNCGSKEIVANRLISNNLNKFDLVQVDTIHNRDEFKRQLDLHCPNGIDLAFIDGNHSYAGIANDFFMVYPRLTSTGVVVFHDTTRIDGCREFVLDLRTKYYDGTFDVADYPFGNGPRRCGISVVTKRTLPVISIGIDEVCGSLCDAHEIESKEQEWFVKEKEGKPQMPTIFEGELKTHKLGYYPNRNKFQIV